MLLLIIILCLVERDGGNGAQRLCKRIGALHKRGVVQLHALGGQRAVSSGGGHDIALAPVKIVSAEIVKARADHRKLTAGNDKALLVHDTDDPVNGIFHLDDNILEYLARHNICLPCFAAASS